MKKQILALILAISSVMLAGCPNAEAKQNSDTEKYVNTTNEEVEAPENNEEKTENFEPNIPNDSYYETPYEDSHIITPEDEPYEWVEPVTEEQNNTPSIPQIPKPETPNPGYDYKPVIYLYPTQTTEISVNLEYNGILTTTYPKYINGWNVTAEPDGTISYNNRKYYCLFWEGISNVTYSLDKGFCVKGEDTEKFLEDSLKQLGLTDKEANEFIIFWLPKMENNAYNIISFQEELYTENAKLTISPTPDTIIRVFMAWKSSDEFIDIPPQKLSAPKRNGFTVVEWGGSELN